MKLVKGMHKYRDNEGFRNVNFNLTQKAERLFLFRFLKRFTVCILSLPKSCTKDAYTWRVFETVVTQRRFNSRVWRLPRNNLSCPHQRHSSLRTKSVVSLCAVLNKGYEYQKLVQFALKKIYKEFCAESFILYVTS